MNINKIAEVCHEANKAVCEAFGDFTQKPWDKALDWQHESAIDGVKLHIENPNAGPAFSHNMWVAYKKARGWKWGKEKDADLKTHPCIVPFNELPANQQAKDILFKAIVHSLSSELNK